MGGQNSRSSSGLCLCVFACFSADHELTWVSGETNSSRFELYCLIGETYNSGLPLGFILISSTASLPGGTVRVLTAFLSHFQNKWNLKTIKWNLTCALCLSRGYLASWSAEGDDDISKEVQEGVGTSPPPCPVRPRLQDRCLWMGVSMPCSQVQCFPFV